MIWFGWLLWHINHCRLFNAKSSLYIYIKYIWFGFGWVLWHINHCRLFNTLSSFSYIKYVGFGLVDFHGISTIVGYLMPNPLYTYISNIYMIWKPILLITSLNKPELYLHSVKWLQVSLYNSHNLTSVICFHSFYQTKRHARSLAEWVECSPMVRETGVQSQVASYQRL